MLSCVFDHILSCLKSDDIMIIDVIIFTIGNLTTEDYNISRILLERGKLIQRLTQIMQDMVLPKNTLANINWIISNITNIDAKNKQNLLDDIERKQLILLLKT